MHGCSSCLQLLPQGRRRSRVEASNAPVRRRCIGRPPPARPRGFLWPRQGAAAGCEEGRVGPTRGHAGARVGCDAGAADSFCAHSHGLGGSIAGLLRLFAVKLSHGCHPAVGALELSKCTSMNVERSRRLQIVTRHSDSWRKEGTQADQRIVIPVAPHSGPPAKRLPPNFQYDPPPSDAHTRQDPAHVHWKHTVGERPRLRDGRRRRDCRRGGGRAAFRVHGGSGAVVATTRQTEGR